MLRRAAISMIYWRLEGKGPGNEVDYVQYVYHCCLCLIFDQTAMAQEQQYSPNSNSADGTLAC